RCYQREKLARHVKRSALRVRDLPEVYGVRAPVASGRLRRLGGVIPCAREEDRRGIVPAKAFLQQIRWVESSSASPPAMRPFRQRPAMTLLREPPSASDPRTNHAPIASAGVPDYLLI